MPGLLILCSTPIGNLDDASPRLAAALSAADVVYAEDTRRSRVLLDRLGVEAALRSYFVGNEKSRSVEVRNRLAAGETIALITDAGTPAVSDPGVSAVRSAGLAGAQVTVVPGPSAVTAALAVSGMPADRFVFEGFLPRKTGERRRRLEELANEARTMVLFAAASRLVTDLEAIADVFGAGRAIVVAREMTKIHEEVFRGTIAGAVRRWSEEETPRGEFTLVVAGAPPAASRIPDLLPDVAAEIEAGRSLSEAVRVVAELAGVSRRGLYEAVLRARDGA